nr:hypothetical protein GCM10020093_094350 [Planobispora longispora]
MIADPATKLFRRRVIWNDELLVGLPGGGRIRVAAEDPLVVRVAAALREDEGERVRTLARLGVRYVLETSGENMFRGGVTVFQDREIRLTRLDFPS